MKEELEIEMVRYMKLSPELTHRKHETQQCRWKREDPGAQERIKMIRAFQEVNGLWKLLGIFLMCLLISVMSFICKL